MFYFFLFCFNSKYSSRVHVRIAIRDQNIDLGYTLEVTSTHNHCFKTESRNKVYHSKSRFSHIKVEFDGGLNYTGVLASYSTT